MGNALVNTLANIQITNTGMMMIAWLFGVIMDFLMTPVAALSAFSVPIASICEQLGFSISGVLYSFIWGVEQFIFPYEWALFLVVYGYGMITSKDTLKFGLARMILSFVFMLIILVPCWTLLGFK